MNVHEYQGKEILRKYGVATPRGIACFSVDEAVKAAETLGGKVWVVKAQIHAGGRGKGGGVKVAKSIDEVREHAAKILGMTLVTHQTGPQGRLVKRLLIEEGADIKKELYVGMVVDRASQRVVLMASSEGGMDIEHVAEHTPEKIFKVAIDPVAGLSTAAAEDVARKIGIPDQAVAQGAAFMQSCLIHEIAFAQVRAVSNVVERRNRDAWKLAEAIGALGMTALSILDHQ